MKRLLLGLEFAGFAGRGVSEARSGRLPKNFFRDFSMFILPCPVELFSCISCDAQAKVSRLPSSFLAPIDIALTLSVESV
jgi:hypothetical protein